MTDEANSCDEVSIQMGTHEGGWGIQVTNGSVCIVLFSFQLSLFCSALLLLYLYRLVYASLRLLEAFLSQVSVGMDISLRVFFRLS